MTKKKGCDNLSKLSRETTTKTKNTVEFQEPSLKEREQNKKSFLKKLLTNKTTHDNINELLTQTTDKQHK